MIRPIKDNRRKKAAKREPEMFPEDVEAFLILLLYKAGGTLTVSMKSLRKFRALKNKNRTLMSYDPDNETVTLRAPEIELPERIVTPKKKIITELS